MNSVLPTSSVTTKDFSFQRQAKNEVVHGVQASPSLEKTEMDNVPILVQQLTRLVQKLLSPFVPASAVFADKTGNIHNRK